MMCLDVLMSSLEFSLVVIRRGREVGCGGGREE